MVSADAERGGAALVTGATGGLGRALCAALRKEGRVVRATGRNREAGRELQASGCEFVAADLAALIPADLTRGVDTVFHLAALSRPWGRREEFEAINLHATESLLEAARASGCRAFIYASTPSIFTTARDRLDIAEDDPVAAPMANHYASTKYRAERIVLAAHGTGFATAALRPRAIVGPHDTVLLPRLLRAARRGIMPLPGGGEALIEITDVRDVVAAFLAAEERIAEGSGKAFNIAGGHPLRLKRLLEIVLGELDLSVRWLRLSAPALHRLAGVLETICTRLPGRPEPLLTRYMAHTLSYSQTLDTARARRVLGWQPRYTPEAAIAHALAGGAA
jgi:nucleoside-diphosphate-sugar epimerase